MVATEVGKSGLILAFSGTMQIPDQIYIGDGSLAVSVDLTGLANVYEGNPITDRSFPANKQITLEANFGAAQLSGNTLGEFGAVTSGATLASGLTLWNYENVQPNLSFDGTVETQIQITFETF